MANPTPIYTVEYAGTQLPGYVQLDDRPVSARNITDTLFGRDGRSVKRSGWAGRSIRLNMLALSRLGSNSSGLQHLEDCKAQWREALRIVTRPTGDNALQIHDSDRYYMAAFESSTAPFQAGSSRRLEYTLAFDAQPWAFAATPVSTTFASTGVKTVTGLDNSRRAYATLTIPNGVTALVGTDALGHTIDFARGSFSGTITVDTGAMTVTTAGGVNAIDAMQNLNFGLAYDDDTGEFDFTVTTYTGSGTITLEVTPRYEL